MWLTNMLAFFTNLGLRLSVSRRFLAESRLLPGAKGAQWFDWRRMTGALRAFGGGRRCFAPAPLLRSLYSLLLQHPVTRFPAAWGAPTRGETMDRQFRILKSR